MHDRTRRYNAHPDQNGRRFRLSCVLQRVNASLRPATRAFTSRARSCGALARSAGDPPLQKGCETAVGGENQTARVPLARITPLRDIYECRVATASSWRIRSLFGCSDGGKLLCLEMGPFAECNC
ncbi:unnamed protein product [Ixodes pacificus]